MGYFVNGVMSASSWSLVLNDRLCRCLSILFSPFAAHIVAVHRYLVRSLDTSSNYAFSHQEPRLPRLCDIRRCFNISAASSFELSNTVIVATSGQIGEAADYSPFHPSGTNNEQFSGGHAEQFELAFKNIEKSLLAAQPNLSSQELWEGVFNMTSFHVGAVPQQDQLEIAAVARRYLRLNKPAWAAICVAALFPPKCPVEVQVQAAYKKAD